MFPDRARPGPAEAALSAAERWDAALLAWPRAHLLQSHGWGEVQARAGWRVHRIEVEVEGRVLPVQALCGAAAVPGLPPRLYVPRGPACLPGDALAWRAVLAALDGLAEREGAAAVTVEPNASAAEWSAVAPPLPPAAWSAGGGLQPARTAIVDLRGGMDSVLARMRPKGRYNARYAERHGVVVAPPRRDRAAGAALSGLIATTADRQSVTLPSEAHVRRVLELVPSACVLLAEVEGEPVAGLLLTMFGGEAIYLYGGSSGRHRERQPSALLHLEAMRHAVEAGCTAYDLWGIAPPGDPDHPWHGLRQFKLALGGVETVMAEALTQVRRPVAWRAASALVRARHAARRLRRPRSTVNRAVQSPTA